MAKGNIFMGTVKGRIGDQVLYVSKGEQNIIKYQKNVTNPRSNGQMYQRARFSNAGRFFTRGRKAFFKFAFENKKKSQSDFNAFMKANINRSVLISKSALAVAEYPAIGKFIMCQGSLKALQNRVVNDYWQASFGIRAQATNPTTVGELSKILIDSNGYEQGDFLTFVWLNTTTSDMIPSITPTGSYSTDWQIKQFHINPFDNTPLANYEMRATSRSWDNIALLTLTDLEDSQMLTSAYGGFVAVHSRNTAGGLKVSTQELTIGESMQDAYDYCQTDEYIQQVLENWKTVDTVNVVPDAILKGSIALQPTTVKGVSVAAAEGSIFVPVGYSFFSTGNLGYNDTQLVGYIVGEGLTTDMLTAEHQSGVEGGSISFSQVDENTVAITLDTPESGDGRASFRIKLNSGGTISVVANVIYTIGNSGDQTFTLSAWASSNVTISGNVVSVNGDMPTDGTAEGFDILPDPTVSYTELEVVQTKGATANYCRVQEQNGHPVAYAVVPSSANWVAGVYEYKIMYGTQTVAIVTFFLPLISDANIESVRAIGGSVTTSEQPYYFDLTSPSIQDNQSGWDTICLCIATCSRTPKLTFSDSNSWGATNIQWDAESKATAISNGRPSEITNLMGDSDYLYVLQCGQGQLPPEGTTSTWSLIDIAADPEQPFMVFNIHR